MTILEVTRAATGYFEKHCIENPRLNAEHLVAHTLGLRRLDLYLQFESELTDAQLASLRDLTRQRGEGVPLQHLIGTVDFLGHTYRVDARALIPRPETEQLAEILVSRLKKRATAPSAILDMGTGSGVLALTLAMAFPQASIAAVDISADALALARENWEKRGSPENLTFLQSDLLHRVEGTFDVAVANLPYVATGEIPRLQPEVLHDPATALDGGPEGHELIGRFLRALPPFLSPGSLVALEIGASQAGPLAALLAGEKFQDIGIVPDYSNIERFLFAAYG